MDLTSLFMFFLMLTGLTMAFVSYYIFYKLSPTCFSKELLSQLKYSIYVNVFIVAVAMGFFMCINNCECGLTSSRGKSGYHKYLDVMLVIILVLSSYNIYLTNSINKYIHENKCEIDKILINGLYGVNGFQLLICLYFIITSIMDRMRRDPTHSSSKPVSSMPMPPIIVV